MRTIRFILAGAMLCGITLVQTSSVRGAETDCGTLYDWNNQEWWGVREEHSAMELPPDGSYTQVDTHPDRHDPHYTFSTPWTGGHATHSPCR